MGHTYLSVVIEIKLQVKAAENTAEDANLGNGEKSENAANKEQEAAGPKTDQTNNRKFDEANSQGVADAQEFVDDTARLNYETTKQENQEEDLEKVKAPIEKESVTAPSNNGGTTGTDETETAGTTEAPVNVIKKTCFGTHLGGGYVITSEPCMAKYLVSSRFDFLHKSKTYQALNLDELMRIGIEIYVHVYLKPTKGDSKVALNDLKKLEPLEVDTLYKVIGGGNDFIILHFPYLDHKVDRACVPWDIYREMNFPVFPELYPDVTSAKWASTTPDTFDTPSDSSKPFINNPVTPMTTDKCVKSSPLTNQPHKTFFCLKDSKNKYDDGAGVFLEKEMTSYLAGVSVNKREDNFNTFKNGVVYKLDGTTVSWLKSIAVVREDTEFKKCPSPIEVKLPEFIPNKDIDNFSLQPFVRIQVNNNGVITYCDGTKLGTFNKKSDNDNDNKADAKVSLSAGFVLTSDACVEQCIEARSPDKTKPSTNIKLGCTINIVCQEGQAKTIAFRPVTFVHRHKTSELLYKSFKENETDLAVLTYTKERGSTRRNEAMETMCVCWNRQEDIGNFNYVTNIYMTESKTANPGKDLKGNAASDAVEFNKFRVSNNIERGSEFYLYSSFAATVDPFTEVGTSKGDAGETKVSEPGVVQDNVKSQEASEIEAKNADEAPPPADSSQETSEKETPVMPSTPKSDPKTTGRLGSGVIRFGINEQPCLVAMRMDMSVVNPEKSVKIVGNVQRWLESIPNRKTTRLSWPIAEFIFVSL